LRVSGLGGARRSSGGGPTVLRVEELLAELVEAKVPEGNTGTLGQNSHFSSSGVYRLQAGIDQVEIRLQLVPNPSGILSRLDQKPTGVPGRFRLGTVSMFGKWEPWRGLNVMWNPTSNRLWVDLHPHEKGRVLPLDQLGAVVSGELEKLAVVGVQTWEAVTVSRVDVAVDCLFESPALGRAFMQSVKEARLVRGRQVHLPKPDPETVYVKSPNGKGRLGRAYDKGRESRSVEPWRWIRLESEHRWKGSETPEVGDLTPDALRALWRDRYVDGMKLPRVNLGGLAVTVAQLLADGEISTRQAESLLAFMEWEKLGVLESVYTPAELRARKQLARDFGVVAEHSGDVGEDLRAVLAEFSGQLSG
jgi:hypothetical protein